MNGSSTPHDGFGARMWRAALELIYPARCAACDVILDEPDDAFCRGCALTLAPIASACPRCARPTAARLAHPAPCIGCLEHPPRFSLAASGSIWCDITRLNLVATSLSAEQNVRSTVRGTVTTHRAWYAPIRQPAAC